LQSTAVIWSIAEKTLHDVAMVPITSEFQKYDSPHFVTYAATAWLCLCNNVAARRKERRMMYHHTAVQLRPTGLAADFVDGTEFQRISCDNNDNNFCLTERLHFVVFDRLLGEQRATAAAE